MKRVLLGLILPICFILASFDLTAAVEVGQPAPDFELDSTKDGKVKLSNLKGKNVLINFYVLDYDPA